MRSRTIATTLLLLALAMPAAAGEKRVTVDVGSRPVRGEVSAPVTVIEFLDFQ